MRLALRLVAGSAVVAVAVQVVAAGCVERSLSAYYYTPARPFWVVALVVLGVALVAARGASVAHGMALDATGALAAFVGVVPAKASTVCSPSPAVRRPEVVDAVHVAAAFLLFLGLFAVVVAARDLAVAAAMVGAGAVAAVLCLVGWAHWFVTAEVMFAAAFGAYWLRRGGRPGRGRGDLCPGVAGSDLGGGDHE